MDPDTHVPEPETLALRELQTVMADAETALARRMRMHPTDLAAMSHLSLSDGPLGPGELAHRLGLSPAAATEVVDRLTAAGHVERHRDLADRRRIRLEASASAVADVRGQLDALVGALDAVAQEGTADQRAAVQGFLRRVTAIYTDWTRSGSTRRA